MAAIVSLREVMTLHIFTPELNHFVDTDVLALGMQVGAKGTYTTLNLMNPKLMLDYWNLCEAGQWDEAMKIAMRISHWSYVAVRPLHAKGYRDPSLDKAFTELGGWLPGNRRARKPYHALTDEDFAQLRTATEQTYPELLAYK